MGTHRKLVVQLNEEDRGSLRTLLRGGIQPVRVVQRARSLLLLDEGQSPPAVARAVGISAPAVRHIGWRYCSGGLERALHDLPRPGAEPALDASERARIIAMVCSDAPPGYARWTVRLITQEAVKRKLVNSVGRETIRLLLLDHDLKPWREKNVVYRGPGRRVRRQNGGRSGAIRTPLRCGGTRGLPG